MRPELILASSSRYRGELLSRLGLPFTQIAPNIDEAIRIDELPSDLVMRLAQEKAQAIADIHPAALVIGSDQIAEIDGKIIGKPGNAEAAFQQLQSMSGRTVRFLTGVCIASNNPEQIERELSIVRVTFRNLASDEIQRYIDQEKPFDCAGSFKSEGLGIALFETIHSDDPTALIGLPMISVCKLLRAFAYPII